ECMQKGALHMSSFRIALGRSRARPLAATLSRRLVRFARRDLAACIAALCLVPLAGSQIALAAEHSGAQRHAAALAHEEAPVLFFGESWHHAAGAPIEMPVTQ